ncbi:sugar phosphate isomerase/epimerase family protein [Catalinimonas niigatensis]|uniref:sugar phosphate isomerase/epimerase family protein n=1 Tax=Catalinimonas niigatensis TaxID=1397264 RepID=UPI002665765A|nr:sugar phosphate isomerase/epimerase [Catalinimonas niigatensis]WPP52328.1 sugar phosphate isomerase/epimerase [Catalinimonas niigatensis]
MNNPIWIMSSAFDSLSFSEVLLKAQEVGAQGIDLCVFRRDGTRTDHVATHLDYESFTLDSARKVTDAFNKVGLKVSIGAFENCIGGNPEQQVKNQNHLLRLIRIAHLLGGDENDVTVGTFVGYNHELGNLENGFQKNLERYQKIFTPIIKYAEDLGVTVIYENCPMEGWRSAAYTGTFNNLTGVLAARKLMYEMIPSPAHGEIYDPSHDVWQHTDPVEVIKATNIERVKRIHVKATRNLKNEKQIHWGGMYPVQQVDQNLAQKAGVPLPDHEWDRHNYEAMLPGFGGSDSMDWRRFVDTLKEKGFEGPFEIENEAVLSKATGNMGAIVQGYQATIMFLSPMLWPLTKQGYQYDRKAYQPLKQVAQKDIPEVSMSELA